jgi:hypothetical protein
MQANTLQSMVMFVCLISRTFSANNSLTTNQRTVPNKQGVNLHSTVHPNFPNPPMQACIYDHSTDTVSTLQSCCIRTSSPHMPPCPDGGALAPAPMRRRAAAWPRGDGASSPSRSCSGVRQRGPGAIAASGEVSKSPGIGIRRPWWHWAGLAQSR